MTWRRATGSGHVPFEVPARILSRPPIERGSELRLFISRRFRAPFRRTSTAHHSGVNAPRWSRGSLSTPKMHLSQQHPFFGSLYLYGGVESIYLYWYRLGGSTPPDNPKSAWPCLLLASDFSSFSRPAEISPPREKSHVASPTLRLPTARCGGCRLWRCFRREPAQSGPPASG
ncbi:hypothetical protein BDY21DRAFT_343632 [Lineolata rhizophorae]|uniref:Uncharacterized protein n=1 Tax=Lineolata rhizophorae TaxID=578093 RepID=A0A6A6P087_9PEZI|nr:hypothetical protein BDY21DRAFT_343632 [Lineolata rhizophorae]